MERMEEGKAAKEGQATKLKEGQAAQEGDPCRFHLCRLFVRQPDTIFTEL